MTDPQNDAPCTSCEVEGPPARLDDDGVCRRCRETHIFGVMPERPNRAAMRREIAAGTYDGGLHRLPTEVCDGR